MSTPRERADARHELRRQRERELVEVLKAAQEAADATNDGEKIVALRYALDLALTALGLRMPGGNDEGAGQ
jgi:hypothetical protein